jgi:hypothetical protein
MQQRRENKQYIIGKRIFNILSAFFVMLLVLYGYFVSVSILNVVVREETERAIVALDSRIGDLEAEYLRKKNAITLEYAYQVGFHTVTEKEFVTRTSLARGLTLRP